MRWAVSALALVVTAACGSGGGADAPTEPPAASTVPSGVEPNAVVDRVVDGDTIDVRIDGDVERVRLIGIDTPEVARDAFADRPAQVAECFGDEASTFTASLLAEGEPVRLERDVVPRDDFGRLLAYVYRASDGVFVNYEIVRQGYAQPLTIPPNVTFSELMVQAARDAEADDAGLWSACG